MISVQRLETRILTLGLNPYSTAKKAGLGADYVRDLLRGKVKQPSASRLRQLAVVLQCSPEYLMGIGDELGEGPPDYENTAALEPVNLRIAYEIKEGFFEGEAPHSLEKDASKWVLSAIPEGDEWLEMVRFSAVPQIVPGSYVHVIEPDKYSSWVSEIAVVERKREGGSLTERSLRRVDVQGEHARFGGLWTSAQRYTLNDLKTGSDPAYGRIVGVVVRGYTFFMPGTVWDDIPF